MRPDILAARGIVMYLRYEIAFSGFTFAATIAINLMEFNTIHRQGRPLPVTGDL
jgi:hypothetical protein